jgi:hypothetical protein
MGYLPVCRAQRPDSRGIFYFSHQSFIRAEYDSRYQNFNIILSKKINSKSWLQLFHFSLPHTNLEYMYVYLTFVGVFKKTKDFWNKIFLLFINFGPKRGARQKILVIYERPDHGLSSYAKISISIFLTKIDFFPGGRWP